MRGVGRRFGGLQAVSDVDLDVAPGERRAILGPNGAGKTTLFNVIAGDIPASTGSVELLGSDVTTRPARARARVGLARTYQQSRVFLGLTVEESIYLATLGVRGGHLRPVILPKRDAELRKRAGAAAARVAISHKLDTRRRVALARGAAAGGACDGARLRAKILMLDEPASGLSRGERTLLTDLLLGLDPEITLVLIEHDMDVALRVAERVTMMHEGRVIVEGTPDEIRANELVHEPLSRHRLSQ